MDKNILLSFIHTKDKRQQRQSSDFYIFKIRFCDLKCMFDELWMHLYEAVIVQCTLDGSAIQTFLSWRGSKPAETLVQEKSRNPHANCQ